MINIDPDIVQRIKVAGLFVLELYRVTTGTMLSLFIPQSCGGEICSLQQNYENSDGYHKTVLYWNMFSFITFFMYYLVELRREEWCIKYLDIDNDKPDNCLKQIIVKYPELDKKMDRLNLIYYRTLLFNCGVYTINLGLTGKLIKDGYHSSSTLSCFASFTLLVLMKLYSSLEVARDSIKNDKMSSAFMKEFVSHNVIDSDYLANKEKDNLIDNEKGPTIILTAEDNEPDESDESDQVNVNPELIPKPKPLQLEHIECIIEETNEETI